MGRSSLLHKRSHVPTRESAEVDRSARDVTRGLSAVPFLAGTMKRVSFVANTAKIVNHSLGEPAAFMPIRVQGAPLYGGEIIDPGWISRARAIGTWQNTGFNQTNGTRWQLVTPRMIVGVRFAWVWAVANKTIRAVLWRDSSGLAVREANVTVTRTGIFEAKFDKPYLMPAGVDFTVSYYDLAATQQVTTTDGVWKALGAMNVTPDLILQNPALVSGGNARPTVTHGAATSTLAEPIFAATPGFAEDVDQTLLNEKHQLRIVSATTCTADLWFYPRPRETTPQ